MDLLHSGVTLSGACHERSRMVEGLAENCRVPALKRKTLEEVAVFLSPPLLAPQEAGLSRSASLARRATARGLTDLSGL